MATITINPMNSYWREREAPASIDFVAGGTHGLPSYFDLQLQVLAGDSLAYLPLVGQWLDGWCINPNPPIVAKNSSFEHTTIFSSYEAALLPDAMFAGSSIVGNDPAIQSALKSINWLLNQPFAQNPPGGDPPPTMPVDQFTYGEVQSAMWILLGYNNPPTQDFTSLTTGGDLDVDGLEVPADVNFLVAQATANNNFVPDFGDYIGVILSSPKGGLDPVRDEPGRSQPIIIEVKAAALGDFVWDDDGDGIQEAGELGHNGVQVKLVRDLNFDGDFNDVNEVLATTTTGANPTGDDPTTPGDESNGYYVFKGLTPGLDYQVQFVLPAGKTFTLKDQGPDNTDSDANVLTGVTPIVVLAPGEFNRTIDAGLVPGSPPLASLGDFVWHDLNADGQQAAGEAGINGVTVSLFTGVDGPDLDNILDTFVSSTVTGAGPNDPTTPGSELNGFYQFTNLTPGQSYQVVFTNPDTIGGDRYFFSPQNTLPDTTDSDAVPNAGETIGRSQVVTLGAGEFNRTIDAGLYRNGSIHPFGYLDTDGDGNHDLTETAFPLDPGKTFVLTGDIDGDGDIESISGTTDINGEVHFEGLTPGEYKLKEDPIPTGYVLTSAINERTFIVHSGEELVYKDGVANVGDADERFETNLDFQLKWGNTTPEPGLQILKDVVGSHIVEPNTPVTFMYSVINTGLLPIDGSEIVVIDDNGTPGFTADDFHPTPVLQVAPDPFPGKIEGDTDGDDILDPGETWKYSYTTIPPLQGTLIFNGGPIDSGEISYLLLPGGDIRVFFRQGLDINDNNYRSSGNAPTWNRSHTFGNLTGSDKAGFDVRYSDGTLLANFYQDYISLGGTNTEGYAAFSGYQSLGISGGDGDPGAGNMAVLKDFDTTLEYNMNQLGAGINGVNYVNMTSNSPGDNDPNTLLPEDPNWIYEMGYFFTIDASAFTTKSFGGVSVFDQHNSPSKGPSGEPTFRFEGSTNTATVFVDEDGDGKQDPGEMSDTDTETVEPAPPPPTKFFVVDSGTDDIYKYGVNGTDNGDFALNANDKDARGLAANADGSKLWVLDKSKIVYLYDANGGGLGSWKASGVPGIDLNTPEGIAVSPDDPITPFNESDVWIVDSGRDRIYYYENEGSRTSGTDAATTSFSIATALMGAATNAKGIVTDGTSLWIVNDGSGTNNTVLKYTIGGTSAAPTLTLAASWKLALANTTPTGLTIDPTGGNQIWVVDSGTDTVYEYANGRSINTIGLGNQLASTSFKLDSLNKTAQDIADPRPFSNSGLVDDDAVPTQGMGSIVSPQASEGAATVLQALYDAFQEANNAHAAAGLEQAIEQHDTHAPVELIGSQAHQPEYVA